jgi:hypothetical protein
LSKNQKTTKKSNPMLRSTAEGTFEENGAVEKQKNKRNTLAIYHHKSRHVLKPKDFDWTHLVIYNMSISPLHRALQAFIATKSA